MISGISAEEIQNHGFLSLKMKSARWYKVSAVQQVINPTLALSEGVSDLCTDAVGDPRLHQQELYWPSGAQTQVQLQQLHGKLL